MKYRAALIGCGKIGSQFSEDPLVKDIYTHAEAYSFCADTELVSVCDSDLQKLHHCSARWNVNNTYTVLKRMLLEQEPEIVSICTPDNTHYTLIREAILSPSVRAILAEKPLAMKLDDAIELINLADKNNVILAVNYSRRYAKNHQDLRNSILNGDIGAIRTISGYYGKGTLHNGTHWFDLLRFLFGDVCSVRAFNRLKEETNDPTLDVHLELNNQIFAYLHGSDAGSFSIFELDIMGSHGRVIISDSGHTMKYYRVSDSPYYTGYKTLTLFSETNGGMEDTLLNAVEDIIACLEKGKEPLCSGKDGVEALRIADAARISARKNRLIYLTNYDAK